MKKIAPQWLLLVCLWTPTQSNNMKGGTSITTEQFLNLSAVQITQDGLKEPCLAAIFGSSKVLTSPFCKCPCKMKGEYSSDGHPVDLHGSVSADNSTNFGVGGYDLGGGNFKAGYQAATLVMDKWAFLQYVVNDDYPTGVALGGEPSKAAAVNWNTTLCEDAYKKVKPPEWPEDLPDDEVFCIFPGVDPIDVAVKGIEVVNGTACDDSVGSPVLLRDSGEVLAIVLKTFCGKDNVAIAVGVYTLAPPPTVPTLEPMTTPSAGPVFSTTAGPPPRTDTEPTPANKCETASAFLSLIIIVVYSAITPDT